jgi:hypothetical protein
MQIKIHRKELLASRNDLFQDISSVFAAKLILLGPSKSIAAHTQSAVQPRISFGRDYIVK